HGVGRADVGQEGSIGVRGPSVRRPFGQRRSPNLVVSPVAPLLPGTGFTAGTPRQPMRVSGGTTWHKIGPKSTLVRPPLWHPPGQAQFRFALGDVIPPWTTPFTLQSSAVWKEFVPPIRVHWA